MNLSEVAGPAGAVVSFLLTLMVVSYIFGDNFLFRLAIHIFIGVAAGYAVVLVAYNVIWYQLFVPLIQSPMENLSLIVPPLLLGIWLLSKASPSLSRLGTPVLALLVGIGAAAAISGAVQGTLFPQVAASANVMDLRTVQPGGPNLVLWFLNGLIILAGTVATLAYFHFGASSPADQPSRRWIWLETAAQVGKVFIAITFGVLFAGVYAAALAALVERVAFSWNFIWEFISQFIPIQ